jgi:5-methylcytosine-specific restriction protein B
MAYYRSAEAEKVYAAARRVVDAGLREDGSVFTPGAAIWTLDQVEDLYRRFVQQPDTSSASFEQKLRRQLEGAPAATFQAMGELLFLHLLIAADIGGASKRKTIQTVLSWSPQPVAIPADLAATLDHGLANTGVAFKTYRPYQLWYLIEFLRAWKRLDARERSRLLEDSWAFKEFAFSVPIKAAYTQREALLHLVHPVTFERIVSRDHKRKIVEHLRDPADEEPDVDRVLVRIRASLEGELGEGFDFYQPPVDARWQPPPVEVRDGEAPTRRAWLVRGANVQGENLVPTWLADGYCAVGWPEAGELPPGSAREQILARLQEAYPDQTAGWLRNSAGTIHRFLTQMRPNDLVVTPDGDNVYVGLIASEPYWEAADTTHSGRRRSVEWANPDRPISRRSLSDSAFSKLRSLLTVTEITEDLDEWLRQAELHVAAGPPAGGAVRRTRAPLAPPTPALAEELLVPLKWLTNMLDLLGEKRQLVFYGPPGTGKTYIAQALARHLTQTGGNYTLVQFHPSYAYEDFFEGFRPRPAGDASGTVGFELVPGPLRRLADAAREDRGHPYVLVIDEVNRANLAKVFGELYFLLEYRDEVVALQYSPDSEFTLPDNLYLIATMNTADRSIALIDAAMRRRFYFIPFFPGSEPIRGLLRRWLQARQLPTEPADLLDALNRRIGEEDFAVGPSYLMHPSITESERLDRVWRHAILPLLEEHYFGTGVDIEARFGLEALTKDLEAAGSAE